MTNAEYYQVTEKDDYDVLFFGTMKECEQWIHREGKMNVTYEIELSKIRKERSYDHTSTV